jgi:hypothetical protein
MQACFADLSRAERAHVRRCQFVAQAEGMAVVSSGVLAAPVASAPAGAHFWLVSSGLSGVVSVVWLAEGRLCCGCSRRRAGALTCSHAQTVRLWLLAAAGVRVPALVPVAPEPEPDPPCPPSGSSSSSSPAGDSSPAPAGELAPVVATQGVICPACERPADAGIIRDWGICAECLDDLADAERQPRPARCCVPGCSALAYGEASTGCYCAAHVTELRLYSARELRPTTWVFGDVEEA